MRFKMITASVLFLILFQSFGFASDNSENEHEYGSCAFACESIPPDQEVPRYFGQDSAEALTSRRFSILVWNLYKGKLDLFAPSFAELSAERDLILLSEVITEAPVLPSLLAHPGFGWHFTTNFLMKDDVGTGTAIGSYAKAANVQHFRTKDVEPFSNTPKAITAGEYPIKGHHQNLLVLSIHGINWSGDEAIVRQVEDVMPLIRSHQGPVIFAGDFNFKNKTRLSEVSKLLATAGLTRVPWENPMKKKQLDDAFSRGLIVHRATLVHDYVDIGSDHPALDLDLEVPSLPPLLGQQ